MRAENERLLAVNEQLQQSINQLVEENKTLQVFLEQQARALTTSSTEQALIDENERLENLTKQQLDLINSQNSQINSQNEQLESLNTENQKLHSFLIALEP